MPEFLRVRRGGSPGCRWAPVLLCLLGCLPLLLLGSDRNLRAEDEPAPEPPPVEEPTPLTMSRVRTDPLGEVTRIAQRAELALAAGDDASAFEDLVWLCEHYPDVLQPASRWQAGVGSERALRRPVIELAAEALVRLEPAFQARLLERWGPASERLAQAAGRGDRQALLRLGREYAALPAGRRALLLLADVQEEEGRRLEAARTLERWLSLSPGALATTRAAVAIRLAGLLGALEDSGALDCLAMQQAVLLDVGTGTVPRTLADALSQRRLAARGAPLTSTPSPIVDGEELLGLWSLNLSDTRSLPADGVWMAWTSLVTAAIATQADDLFVHAGRRVRCVDRWTGLERWVFPGDLPPALHAASERYPECDLPHRALVPAGELVLTVLGDPVASGDYQFRGEEHEAHVLGQESRTRLIALDARTGELRWCTGTAESTHVVLGDPHCGCISPPLVVGDRVYALFGRLAGGAEVYLACLDLHSGAPHYVTWLGAGTGGRSEDRAEANRRMGSPYVLALPWAAPPVLSAGELCLQTHAGFAAGVDARDGSVRWVRSLPRYPHGSLPRADGGRRVSNAPLPWGDAWILAPMDCPEVQSVARGSGALRWSAALGSDDGLPMQLMGIGPGRAGAPVLMLGGPQAWELDPATGAVLDHRPEPWGPEQSVYGRVVAHGSWWVGSDGWRLLATDRAVDDRVHYAGERGFSTGLLRLDLADVSWDPPLWYVLDEGDLVCVANAAAQQALEAQSRIGTDARRLLVRAMLATAQDDTSALLDLVEASADLPRDAHCDQVRERLAIELSRHVTPEGLAPVLGSPALRARLRTALATLPAGGRASLRHLLVRRSLEESADEAAAELLGDWLRDPELAWVDLSGGTGAEDAPTPAGADRLRSDLLALRWLREHVDRPAVQGLLAQWEVDALAKVSAALDAPEDELRRAVARTPGTRAAAQGRERLMQRLAAAGRWQEAANVAADLRLDPPIATRLDDGAERRRRAAQLALQEASWRLRAHDAHRARTLLADLLRWAPSGLVDDEGATRDVLEDLAARRFGWHPERRLDPPEANFALPANEGPSAEEIRAVEILGLAGPGAEIWENRLLLVRGITPELWEVEARGASRLLATLPGSDEGWFGGSLRAVDPWVPGAGILVTDVVAREPADRSGIVAGDWIRSWDGKPVPDLAAFMQRVAATPPDQEIVAEVRRRGERVLDRFLAGRRPAGQGRLLNYGSLWVAEDGRVLLPGRTTLSWVDPHTLGRTPLWQWSEPGVIEHAQVCGPHVLVLVRRRLVADLVVSVDLATGGERWRISVEGDVDRLQPVGSAVWVSTWDPSGGWLVDAHDGSLRATFACAEHYRDEYRRTWAPAHASDVALGRVFAPTSATQAVRALRVLNSTRGTEEWRDAGSTGWADGNRNDMVAAGPVTAVLRRGVLQLCVVDPLGEGARLFTAPSSLLMEAHLHWGPLEDDSRFYVRGWSLFLVRVPDGGRFNVNASSWAIDPFVLAQLDGGAAEEDIPAPLSMRTGQALLTGSGTGLRYLLEAGASFEGLLVLAARLGSEPRVDMRWISAGLRRDHADVRLYEGQVREPRRHLPVHVGARLLVPSDQGAIVLPAPDSE